MLPDYAVKCNGEGGMADVFLAVLGGPEGFGFSKLVVIKRLRASLATDREFGGFKKYLRSFPDYDSVVKDLRKRFKFLGETGSYYFLYVVDEKVPEHEEWAKAHGVSLR